jgi:putative molybdenum carrier protein
MVLIVPGVYRIISGGQTGADRGGLEAAMALGLEHGGWCPLGRRAEDGTIPDQYKLHETDTREYGKRTLYNVRDSDGTAIFGKAFGPGSRLTAKLAMQLGRPSIFVDPWKGADARHLREWLVKKKICVLNVAGNRESKAVGIEMRVRNFLLKVLV